MEKDLNNGRKIKNSCTNDKVILYKAIYTKRTNNRNYGAGVCH